MDQLVEWRTGLLAVFSLHKLLQGELRRERAMTDWSYLLFVSAIYAFGFLGLFGISLLPIRATLALKRNAFLWHSSASGKASLVVVGAAAIAAIAVGVPLVSGVFRCLTEMRCGANRASGWFFVAEFGVCYLAFELVAFLVLAAGRKHAARLRG